MDTTQNVAQRYDDLLDLYSQHSSLYFSSPSHSLLAKPPFAQLVSERVGDIAQRAQESLSIAKQLGFADPIIMGAIGFDGEDASALRVCNNVIRQTKMPFASSNTSGDIAFNPSQAGAHRITPVPSGQVFKNSVNEALALFEQTPLQKVVLSRALDVQFEAAPNIPLALKSLAVKNPLGYTFAVPLNAAAPATAVGNRVLIGASPELLLSKSGKDIHIHPLAGSIARSENPNEDAQRADGLLQSAKDLYEHRVVVDAIEKSLRPFCKSLRVPRTPSLMSTATMWHLGTHITAELKDETLSSLALALALHPTPAVGGYPVADAKQAIKKLEQYPREFFTGIVGWCNAQGDGEWAITIRCAEVFNHRVRVYAGAGVVAGSCAEKEYAETAAKFNTVLNAFGVKPVKERVPKQTKSKVSEEEVHV